MEVEVIFIEIIKPSSPTPDHLRNYQLSFLDQLSPRAYNPILYFYALNHDNTNEANYIAEISEKLKKSLSQALTLYYPLAGRFINDRFVDCNDDGVPFLKAQVKTKLSNVIDNPIPCDQLNRLLPFELDEIAELPLGVQVNVFECGGIAIGACVSHRLADALSCLVFIRSWTAIARGGENVVDTIARPDFVAAALFPPRNLGGFDISNYAMVKNNSIITKRFVFNASKIEALRAKYAVTARGSENQDLKQPSRIVAVSACIWSRLMAAAGVEAKAKDKLYMLSHAVNIRPKFDPPLPEHSFGNLFRASTTIPSTITSNYGEESYVYSLAMKIGEDIRKIDKDYVENFRVEMDEFLEQLKKSVERFFNDEVFVLVFTSLCRFPLNEADFGFGKPTWVSSAARCFKNTVGFMDNKTGDGIEAYISLKPGDMAKFEVDEEFRAFVSVA